MILGLSSFPDNRNSRVDSWCASLSIY